MWTWCIEKIQSSWNRTYACVLCYVVVCCVLISLANPLMNVSSSAGMTKVKVGKEDQSSNEFVEKRRSALERYDEKKEIFFLCMCVCMCHHKNQLGQKAERLNHKY